MGWCGVPWQTNERSKRRTKAGIDRFARTDWGGIEKDGFAYSVTSTAATVPADLKRVVRLPIGRCVALEKLSRVKLVEDVWHTAPNHSRPASCVAEADIDAEDHLERDPQTGH